MGLCQLQAQERYFCDTLHSLCICRLSLACIFRETSSSYKECQLILTVFPHCFLLLTVVDCLSASPFANSFSLLSDISFLPTSGLVGDLELKPLFWFRAKADKEIVCLTHHRRSNSLISRSEQLFFNHMPRGAPLTFFSGKRRLNELQLTRHRRGRCRQRKTLTSMIEKIRYGEKNLVTSHRRPK